jgi:hypothetical protein
LVLLRISQGINKIASIYQIFNNLGVKGLFMDNAALTQTLSNAALVFLFPFILVISHLSPGWNQETIKKDGKVLLNYQVYLPDQKETKTVPVVIVLKDRGGKLSANEVKMIEARSKASNKAIVIPKSPGKEWMESDSELISKLIADLAIKKSLNLNHIELISLSSGAPVAVKLLCSTSIKFQKVYVLGHKVEITGCNNSMQNLVYTNNEFNHQFWTQKSKTLNKTSAKNLVEILKD